MVEILSFSFRKRATRRDCVRLIALGIAMLGLFGCDDKMDQIDSAVGEHSCAESDRIRDAYRADEISFGGVGFVPLLAVFA